MTDATSPSASPHASHDTMVVAALAARAPELSDPELERGRELIATCSGCADLLADLVSLQTALPTTSTPVRPRDLRLTADDAARLHRSGWRRVLGFFGSARDGVSRPLAVGLTTLGLAGLLVASLPSMFMAGGAASAPSPVDAGFGQAAAPAAESYQTDGASAAASGAPEEEVFSGGEPEQVEAERDIAGADDPAISVEGTGPPMLSVVAGLLLIAGLGLFVLRWSARRLLHG